MKKRDKIFFYFGVLPALIFQFIGALFYFFILGDANVAKSVYSFTKVLILLWPIFWVILMKCKLPGVTAKSNVSRSILFGGMFSVILVVGVLFVYRLFSGFFVSSGVDILAKVEDWNVGNYYILFAVFVSIFHSALEEYYWRWFVLKGLMIKFSWFVSAFIGSIAFMSHHVIIISQFFSGWVVVLFSFIVFLLGFIWCFIYRKTGSLWGSWISHIFADAVLLYVGYLLIS